MKFAVTSDATLVATLLATSASASLTFIKGNARAAESIVTQLCVACHAVDGNPPPSPNPKLAGLNAEYLDKQLVDYKTGARKNAIMAGMVAGMTDQDKRNLALYYSAQQPKAGTSKDQALALTGERIFRGGIPGTGVASCAACHGPQGKGIPTQFPRLAGQHSEYIYEQLNQFRLGTRANDSARMMRSIAARMTDAEMRAAAACIQGLR